MGEYEWKVNTLVFELGGVDIILGVAWLATLGNIKANCQTLSMQFNTEKGLVEIKGDPNLGKFLVSPRNLLKLIEVEAMALVWNSAIEYELSTCALDKNENMGNHEELKRVIEEFLGVFEELKGMPPNREVDPVNVRPYKYPHLQKGEIEKQVNEMLQAGIITPSNSPYSSPVILVKKKDGSWRFCVDYKALNKATIPDKFPIPVIEELLDELHGTKHFSKIDLRPRYHQIRMDVADIHKTAVTSQSV